ALFLLTSHDFSVRPSLANRIAWWYRGRIVEPGSRDAVLSPPHHPYTEALLSAVPTITRTDHERIRLPLEGRRSLATTGCVFAGRCPRGIGSLGDSIQRTVPRDRAGTHTHSHLPDT